MIGGWTPVGVGNLVLAPARGPPEPRERPRGVLTPRYANKVRWAGVVAAALKRAPPTRALRARFPTPTGSRRGAPEDGERCRCASTRASLRSSRGALKQDGLRVCDESRVEWTGHTSPSAHDQSPALASRARLSHPSDLRLVPATSRARCSQTDKAPSIAASMSSSTDRAADGCRATTCGKRLQPLFGASLLARARKSPGPHGRCGELHLY